jgi:2'-5' RNA ligase
MPHRIFIAINLPPEIKRQLEKFQSQWPELPVRWTKPENLHITLIFLGYLADQELLDVCKIVKEVASRQKAFSINLTKICYGPPKKMPPRMVWVEGEKSKELANLQIDLEKSLTSSESVKFEPEKRSFSSHINLGRIKTWEFRSIDPEESSQIEQDIYLAFDVASIEVMESELKRTGPEYTILESVELGK